MRLGAPVTKTKCGDSSLLTTILVKGMQAGWIAASQLLAFLVIGETVRLPESGDKKGLPINPLGTPLFGLEISAWLERVFSWSKLLLSLESWSISGNEERGLVDCGQFSIAMLLV